MQMRSDDTRPDLRRQIALEQPQGQRLLSPKNRGVRLKGLVTDRRARFCGGTSRDRQVAVKPPARLSEPLRSGVVGGSETGRPRWWPYAAGAHPSPNCRTTRMGAWMEADRAATRQPCKRASRHRLFLQQGLDNTQRLIAPTVARPAHRPPGSQQPTNVGAPGEDRAVRQHRQGGKRLREHHGMSDRRKRDAGGQRHDTRRTEDACQRSEPSSHGRRLTRWCLQKPSRNQARQQRRCRNEAPRQSLAVAKRRPRDLTGRFTCWQSTELSSW